MDLFTFIRHSDPTKVRIGERKLAEREVKLLKMTEGRTVSLSPLVTTTPEDSGDNIDKLMMLIRRILLKGRKVVEDASGSIYPPKKLTDDYQSLLPKTSGKSLASLRGVVSKGSAVPSGVTKPIIVASVAPVSDFRPLDFVFRTNLRTCPPYVRSLVADASVVTVVVATTVVADIASFSGSKARDASNDLEKVGDSASLGEANADAANISILNKPSTLADSFYASQSLDTKTMHRIYAPIWKVTNDSILEDSYVCRDLTDCVAPPALIAKINWSLHSSSLGNVWRPCRMSRQRFWVTGLRSWMQMSKIAIHLDEELYPRFLTTISGRRWFLTHGLKLVLFKCLQSSEYLQALGKAIGCAVNKGIQDGLKAGIDHRQAGRDLSVIEAYDPSTEATYIDAVNALGAVDFSLFSELESKKDSCIVDLIDSFYLDGILAEEEVKETCLLLTDVITPLVEPLSFKSLTGEASTSAAPITTLSTTFASSDAVLPTSVVNDQVLDAELHNEDPPVVAFEKEETGTSPE
nr:hypothetical protein [Tanacetum cinerariifolium]